MKTSLLPAAAALLLAGTACDSRPAAATPEPIRLIVETDMGNDIDDALAFDLIYKAMDDGRVDLLAIGNHKLSPTATDYIDILNTWYGYPDIPLAQSPTPVLNDHAPDYTAAVCAMTREDGSPAFARSKTPEQIEDPVTLYRRTLAAQPDRSVTVLSLGFATELTKLLESPADDISTLTTRTDCLACHCCRGRKSAVGYPADASVLHRTQYIGHGGWHICWVCSKNQQQREIQNCSNNLENGHGYCDPTHWTVYVLARILN